jgi:hypothetical protein
MQFTQLQEGSYTMNITDVMGRQVHQQAIVISSESQVQNVNLNSSVAKGVYMVSVADENSKNIFTSKLVIQ